ncbi:hypothetical protein SNE26_15015 [Mucilaginibacter sp. cycad4]|uniref:hypothetical protein n=1 Tax=Mucilaginibacter sp. cycad4 TaxID=3342096 RepID=UPI002AAB095A|nr:hypothetical protein [Mucilaginibacter gossypii]WPU97333.1 hypothetical protein SNE26_15015 [Mucilaginibacter gossypii]
MDQPKVFISVGGTSTPQQEDFVKSIEDRLRSENLIPNTIGRNTFSSDSPLKSIKGLMDECSGILVIALERTYFESGIEKRGSANEITLQVTKFATPWNQIESAIAYAKNLPILIIVEEGVRAEGLLEKGNDWYVMTVKPSQSSLSTVEFNGVLASWKSKVEKLSAGKNDTAAEKKKVVPDELTIGDLVSNMKPAQLWGVLGAIIALMAAIFVIGQHFSAK